jgi:hypothetical protein
MSVLTMNANVQQQIHVQCWSCSTLTKKCRILLAGGLGVPPAIKNPPRLGD